MNISKIKAGFLLLVLIFSPFISVQASDKDLKSTLTDYYSNITALDIKFEQTKKSRLFIRPLKTVVFMNYTKDSLSWRQEGRSKPDLYIKDHVINIFNPDTNEYSVLKGVNETAENLIRFIESVVKGDIKSIEQSFDVSFHGLTLNALPKKDVKNPLKLFRISFLSDLKLKEIYFETAKETVKLVVLDMKIKK